MWNREQVVHVLMFEKICGLNSPVGKAVNCVWSWLGVLSTAECSQLDAPCSCDKNGKVFLPICPFFHWALGLLVCKRKKKTSICSVAQSTFFLNPHSVIWVSHYGIIMIWVWYTVCRKVSIFSRRNTTAPERRGKKGKKGRKSVTSKSRLLLTDFRRHPVDLQCLHSAT